MKTISEYSIFVSELAKNRENRIFLNSDEEHGLIVYVNLLKSAKKQIRIFAGRLCEHIGNKPEFVEAISEFIENNGQVSILLNNYDEKIIVNSPLFKRLAYYISEKLFNIYGKELFNSKKIIIYFFSQSAEVFRQ